DAAADAAAGRSGPSTVDGPGRRRADGPPEQRGRPVVRSVLDAEADLQDDLHVGHGSVLDMTADLTHLEPVDVAHGLRRLLDRPADRVVHAGLAAPDDLAEPVHVVAHR